jgi:hypothetical protein
MTDAFESRIIRLEEQVSSLDKNGLRQEGTIARLELRMDEEQSSTNRRFCELQEAINVRFDDMQNEMRRLLYAIIGLTFTVLGSAAAIALSKYMAGL